MTDIYKKPNPPPAPTPGHVLLLPAAHIRSMMDHPATGLTRRSQTKPGPSSWSWSQSHQISCPGLGQGPGPVILLVRALVPVPVPIEKCGPVTQ